MCQAFEDYKEEGRMEEREEAYEKIISIMKKLNVSIDVIKQQLIEEYSLNEIEVEEKLKKYY